MEVKNQIIQSNLRLVVSIAKQYVNSQNELFDLISDGNVSLMRAVEKFDFSFGYKFSTYATWAKSTANNATKAIPSRRTWRSI